VAEESTRQVLPTATGFAAKQAIAALRNHHIATAPLLRRAGLSEHDFAGAENDGNPVSHRVSAVAQVKFLDYAAEAMNDSAFGLHLVEQSDPRDAGIYFYVARLDFTSLSSPTRATPESISMSRPRRKTSTRRWRCMCVTSGSSTKACV
jgi:hypothetical protein